MTYTVSMEEWRKIPGYEKYEINSSGTVRRGERVLRITQNKSGYKQICTCIDSKQSSIKIHRAMALAFIPNPDNKPTVDHINRVIDDNRLENLRWASHTEQCLNREFPLPSSGHKHIMERCRGAYRDFCVAIRRNNTLLFRKYFKTLPEAITARDNFLAISASPPP